MLLMFEERRDFRSSVNCNNPSERLGSRFFGYILTRFKEFGKNFGKIFGRILANFGKNFLQKTVFILEPNRFFPSISIRL